MMKKSRSHSIRAAGRRMIAACRLFVLITMMAIAPTAVNSQERGAVVFDIDGTLTPMGVNLFVFRLDAKKAIELWISKGYRVALITARFEWLGALTRKMLRKWHFPAQAEPFFYPGGDVVSYKSQKVLELEDLWNVTFQYGYGDSTTDFQAWELAGINESQVFALRRKFSFHCQPGVYAACLTNYKSHMDYIRDQPNTS